MVRRINHPAVRVLYDIYHMQVMEGDVTRTILNNLDLISHLHCAGNPGRNEPYMGELNYPEILRMVSEGGYNGAVGIEYTPSVNPREGLMKLYEMYQKFM